MGKKSRRKFWIYSLTVMVCLTVLINAWSLFGPFWYPAPNSLVDESPIVKETPSIALAPATIKVLSLNIHHGRGEDGTIDLQRIANIIEQSGADIVALQEVDRNVKRSGSIDQTARLAELTSMHGEFGVAKSISTGHYGNAILSRFPIRSKQVTALPGGLFREPRSVLACDIQVPGISDPERLVVLSTHLDFFPNPEIRIASANRINELLDNEERACFLLCGDMNCERQDPTILEFRKRWSRLSSDEKLATYPADRPQQEIDHLFCHPASRWRLMALEAVEVSGATDHRGILTELQWLQ